jgi:hypothetical protein
MVKESAAVAVVVVLFFALVALSGAKNLCQV